MQLILQVIQKAENLKISTKHNSQKTRHTFPGNTWRILTKKQLINERKTQNSPKKHESLRWNTTHQETRLTIIKYITKNTTICKTRLLYERKIIENATHSKTRLVQHTTQKKQLIYERKTQNSPKTRMTPLKTRLTRKHDWQ